MSAETDQIMRKLDDMQKAQYNNGLAAKEMEGRVGVTESFIIEHKEDHKDEAKHRRALNWKMWFALIGGFIGLIFLLLKDQVI